MYGKPKKFVCREFKWSDKSALILRDFDGRHDPTEFIRKTYSTGGLFISSSFYDFLKDVFLPRGFPESVHADYVQYQIWDTVQAFASTILGTLTTHSIMRGVGVGESSATPLAAAITWILKDGTGMVGRIMFAWWNGPGLDAHCKKWRLFADVLNDLAMGIELTLPYVPSFSTILLCFSSAMKSLVGVAGGATRASITQHQALRNNLADVSAKDGSQETCVNLIASLIGVFMLSYLDASSHVLFWYLHLVGIHIYANYRAVRALCFDTLNEDRLAIIVKNYLTTSSVPSPKEVNERESLLIFHRATRDSCGFDIEIGEALSRNFTSEKTGDWKSLEITSPLIQSGSLSVIDHDKCFLAVFPCDEASSKDFLQSYIAAFILASFFSIVRNFRPDIQKEAETSKGPFLDLYKMAREARRNFGSAPSALYTWMYEQTSQLLGQLEDSGWKTETNLLPIGPYRFSQRPKIL